MTLSPGWRSIYPDEEACATAPRSSRADWKHYYRAMRVAYREAQRRMFSGSIGVAYGATTVVTKYPAIYGLVPRNGVDL